MRLAPFARLAAAAAVALLVAGASPRRAHAEEARGGTYFTFGVGPGEVSDELGQYAGDTVRIRAGVGHRFGNLAVEGFIASDIADYDAQFSEAGVYGVDLRYLVRISDHLQGYVRGSASHMSLTMGSNGYNDCFDCYGFGRDYGGRGLGGGAGLMLRGKVRAIGFLYWPLFFVPAGPKVNASLFMDHGMDFYRLHAADGSGSIDAVLTRWTFGFTVGQDF